MGCFWFLEAKEAVEVIEASGVIKSVEVIEANAHCNEVLRTTKIVKINKKVAKITLFRCFEKRLFFD